jgi:hypothetical protein
MLSGDGAGYVRLRDIFLSPRARVEALVCGDCGHVELRAEAPGEFHEKALRKRGSA